MHLLLRKIWAASESGTQQLGLGLGTLILHLPLIIKTFSIHEF